MPELDLVQKFVWDSEFHDISSDPALGNRRLYSVMMGQATNDLLDNAEYALIACRINHPPVLPVNLNRYHEGHEFLKPTTAIALPEAAAGSRGPQLLDSGIGLASHQKDVSKMGFVIRPRAVAVAAR
jgi:hypothetical protein